MFIAVLTEISARFTAVDLELRRRDEQIAALNDKLARLELQLQEAQKNLAKGNNDQIFS